VALLQLLCSIKDVERVHLELGGVHQKTRTNELLVKLVIAKNVAHVLAKEALDAFPEFLHAGASGGLGVNFLIRFFARKFEETSVTRSFTSGKARIGSTVTGFVRSSSLSRVMHMRRGIPLISAEHDPHFPALQFQRTARSLAPSAWIW